MNATNGSARLEIIRPIPAGAEIFVSYGAEYWRSARATTHSTTGIPDWEWDLSDPFDFMCRPVPGPSAAPLCRSLRACLGHFLNNSLSVVLKPLPLWTSFPVPAERPRRTVNFWQLALDDLATPPSSVSVAPSTPLPTPTSLPTPTLPTIEIAPPPVFCEVNVGPVSPNCSECIPEVFICPAHLKPCGGSVEFNCFFCDRAICWEHLYCPCSAAAARRQEVLLWGRLGRFAPPEVRGSVSARAPPPDLRPVVPHPRDLRWILDEPSLSTVPACPVVPSVVSCPVVPLVLPRPIHATSSVAVVPSPARARPNVLVSAFPRLSAAL